MHKDKNKKDETVNANPLAGLDKSMVIQEVEHPVSRNKLNVHEFSD